jgi:hypothetical protein
MRNFHVKLRCSSALEGPASACWTKAGPSTHYTRTPTTTAATSTYKVTDHGDPDNCGSVNPVNDAPQGTDRTVTITRIPLRRPRPPRARLPDERYTRPERRLAELVVRREGAADVPAREATLGIGGNGPKPGRLAPGLRCPAPSCHSRRS